MKQQDNNTPKDKIRTHEVMLVLLLILSIVGLALVIKPQAVDGVSAKRADAYDRNATLRTITVNGVQFQMVYVPGGSFRMGADPDLDTVYETDELPAHTVTLDAFRIGQTEVTQELWRAVMGSDPAHFIGDDLPIESINMFEVEEFLVELNRLTGLSFRLPTEAEWEYAARGGARSARYVYSGSDVLTQVCGYDKDIIGINPVASSAPNKLHIYDMTGNVWEWCSDWYGPYSPDDASNPKGPAKGERYVVRGGSWNMVPDRCRVSAREPMAPIARFDDVGFRLVLESDYPKPSRHIRQSHNKHMLASVVPNHSISCEVDDLSITMMQVDGGVYTMGEPVGKSRKASTPHTPHRVKVESFYMGETEVTQLLWSHVMGNNPSIQKGDQLPVDNVTYPQVMEFIGRLNVITGRQFRLPTEAEWEYAARGGEKSRGMSYSGDEDLDKVGWSKDNSKQAPHPVKTLGANELGLYDMSGNVGEWVSDWWSNYPASDQNNPQGPRIGQRRMIRGGSYTMEPRDCVVNRRFSVEPGYHEKGVGFRLVISAADLDKDAHNHADSESDDEK